MPVGCHVAGCDKPAVSKGLCGAHNARVRRHGHLDQTRAPDWGDREKHPAYKVWCGLRRHHRGRMVEEWINDFWAFARDVPPKPADGRAHRSDPDAPWGPQNFFWKQPRTSVTRRADQAAYMREWQRLHRASNRRLCKDRDLRRTYGVTMDWYEATHTAQGGRCAICDREETAVIKGQVLSLAVDHCHDTGDVRGLLCRSCNNAIGAFQHNTDMLQRAIRYLNRRTTQCQII